MSDEFTSCKEALMQVIQNIERKQTGESPDLMRAMIDCYEADLNKL